jgi:hypothetical protein
MLWQVFCAGYAISEKVILIEQFATLKKSGSLVDFRENNPSLIQPGDAAAVRPGPLLGLERNCYSSGQAPANF